MIYLYNKIISREILSMERRKAMASSIKEMEADMKVAGEIISPMVLACLSMEIRSSILENIK